ncbi:MAG: hypothetical protein FJ271_33690 [Planctomycetes bacterium]|nr:hypothetical protein [Planctomycetota bacterium]
MAIDISGFITWGRVVFFILAGALSFGTFVAGQIAGASSLEPRMEALERRTDAVEVKLSKQGEDLAEIKGYVRAIAKGMGVNP